MAEKDPFAGLPEPAEAQALFTNPEFLQGAAMIAAKNRDPSAMKWLEQAHLAAREGAFEAIGHLRAGNPQEAVKVWNRTGQFRDVENVNENKDGTYTITRKGGVTMTLDPAKEYKRFLSPREFVAYEQGERERAERAADRRSLRDYQQAQLDEQRRYHDATLSRYDADRNARLDIAAANAAMRLAGGGGAGSRSSRSGAGGGTDGYTAPLKPKEIVDAYEKAREEATKIAEANTDEKNPTNVDSLALTLMAQKTASLQRNARTGQWGIIIGAPGGDYAPAAEFDSEREARAAMMELLDRRVRPQQVRLARDDRRESAPGEESTPYQSPAVVPREATPQRRSLPEAAPYAAHKAAAEQRSKVKSEREQSPYIVQRRAAMKKAIQAGNSVEANRILAEINAYLNEQ